MLRSRDSRQPDQRSADGTALLAVLATLVALGLLANGCWASFPDSRFDESVTDGLTDITVDGSAPPADVAGDSSQPARDTRLPASDTTPPDTGPPPPDTAKCPTECNDGCAGGVCRRSCSGSTCACPPNVACDLTINCDGASSCSGPVDCAKAGASSCTVNCRNSACDDEIQCPATGECTITCVGGSCQGKIFCGSGRCTINCTGNSCQDDISCGASCACSVRCTGSCAGKTTCRPSCKGTGKECLATPVGKCDAC